MAHKMKRTLTRAEQAKLRKANVERAKGMKEIREKCGKRGVEKEESKEKEKEGVTSRLKRRICTLREIQKYQSGTELLMRRLPFQRVVKEIIQNIRELTVPNHSHNGHTRGRRGLLGGLA